MKENDFSISELASLPATTELGFLEKCNKSYMSNIALTIGIKKSCEISMKVLIILLFYFIILVEKGVFVTCLKEEKLWDYLETLIRKIKKKLI